MRELEQASLRLEQEDSIIDPEYIKWLNMFMAPGSPLGGARPQASVIDPSQQLWIAKFPSKFDDRNVGAWEMVVHHLAKQAQINVADAFIENLVAATIPLSPKDSIESSIKESTLHLP